MKRIIASFAVILLSVQLASGINVVSIKVNHLENPEGISLARPVFSWTYAGDGTDIVQTAYEIVVSLDGRTIWKTGRVEDSNSIHVPYCGPGMLPDSRYELKIRIWDNHGERSPWASSFWSTGLEVKDWKAVWIESEPEWEKAAYFRGGFRLKDRKVKRATAFISAHGWYEAFLNGHRIGKNYLTPGWTSYDTRLQYQAYDVTALLRRGENTADVTVTDGWYKSGMSTHNAVYGNANGVIMQINIHYSDGSSDTVVTDSGWKYSDGEIRYAKVYHGVTIDRNRKEKEWKPVIIPGTPLDNLIATSNQSIINAGEYPALRYFVTPKGDKVIDFGENLAGWEKVTLRGHKGDTVRIRHAETLDGDGELCLSHLRTAKATNTYILSSDGEETFEPSYSYCGFRYISVEGVSGDLDPNDYRKVFVHSDVPKAGSFECSDPLVNRLQANILNSIYSNMYDIQTGCCQRDERLGWTGDIQAISPTSIFLTDSYAFYSKWLTDLAEAQFEDGSVPRFAPYLKDHPGRISSGWSDACAIVPWNLYLSYGDKDILRNNYDCMKRWAEWELAQCNEKHLWKSGNHYGDWLFWSVDDDRDGRSAVTGKYLIAQVYMCNTLKIVRDVAQELGFPEDALRFGREYETARQAFLDEYVTPGGMVGSDTQTAYVLALNYDMLPGSMKQQAVDRLVGNISHYHHITTGFLGTPHILPVLSDGGRSDVAYKLFCRKTPPGWLYQVEKGATSIWERWDSVMPDGSMKVCANGDQMNSLNHHAYGSVGYWLYSRVAGITPMEPGYRTIMIDPCAGGWFSWVRCSKETPYGPVSVSLKGDGKGNVLELEASVPAGTRAYIRTPSGALEERGSGVWRF